MRSGSFTQVTPLRSAEFYLLPVPLPSFTEPKIGFCPHGQLRLQQRAGKNSSMLTPCELSKLALRANVEYPCDQVLLSKSVLVGDSLGHVTFQEI